MKFLLSSFLSFFIVVTIQAQKLARTPYLQQPTQNSITIRWRTDVATTAKVTYINPNVPSVVVYEKVDNTLQTEHIITLTGLLADTKYVYTVGTKDKVLAEGTSYYFVTSPEPTTTKPLRIWTMGDFGDLSTAKYVDNQAAVRKQFLKNRKENTNLWVWLGDNAYCCGTEEEYQTQVFDYYGSEIFGNMAIMPLLGNHEYYGSATAKQDRKIPYFDMVTVPTKGESGGVPSETEAYYSYNYGNIHFIALDSYGLDDGLYGLADTLSKQYKWLRKDLAANTSLWTVVCLHHPPYTKRSHDSDGEADLRLIRQVLVPLFDKYKVDLVLSGHSHSYERSYLMKGHTGQSETFSVATHVVQNTTARYEKDAPPIINKNEGTMYMVVGSAGRLDWNGRPDAHPASVYSNIDIGGSLLLDIQENRLDGQWVCADGLIRDKFTMFKNVNKVTKIAINSGEKVNLSASWNGTFVWSNGVKNQRTISFVPAQSATYTVSDSLGFLSDKFEVTVNAQPQIVSSVAPNTSICAGKTLNFNVTLTNTTFDKWAYTIELSDKVGDFAKPTKLTGTVGAITSVQLPDTLSESSRYRLRVRPNSDLFIESPSISFTVNRVSEAKLLNQLSNPFAPSFTLRIQVKGTLPTTLKVSNLAEQKITQLITENVIPITNGASFKLESLSNVCGVGQLDASTVMVSPRPQITTSLVANQTVCAGKSLNVNVELLNTTFDKWTFVTELSDKNGSFNKPAKFTQAVGASMAILLPDTLSEGANYRLRVRPNSDLFNEVMSASFTINKSAEASLVNTANNAFSSAFTLRLQVKGTLPVTVKISSLAEQKITQLLTDIKATLLTGASFKIESVSNVCGLGTSAGNAIMVANPLAVEPTLGQQYSVYPNPANEAITIKNLYGNVGTTQVILQDISGKKVKELHRNFNEDEIVNFSDLPKGIYILTLKNKQGEWSTKVVKE